MSRISDEAVAEASKVLHGTSWDMEILLSGARAALEAALPHLDLVDWWGVCQVCKGEVANEGGKHASNCPVLLRTRIRELEDGIIEAVSALEHGPLRQIALSNEHIEQLRRRLRALLSEDDK